MKCLFDPQVGTPVLFSNGFNTFDIPIKLPISNANLLDNNQGKGQQLLVYFISIKFSALTIKLLF